MGGVKESYYTADHRGLCSLVASHKNGKSLTKVNINNSFKHHHHHYHTTSITREERKVLINFPTPSRSHSLLLSVTITSVRVWPQFIYLFIYQSQCAGIIIVKEIPSITTLQLFKLEFLEMPAE